MPNFRIALLPGFRFDEWSKAALTILNPLNDNVSFTLVNLPEGEVDIEPRETADVGLAITLMNGCTCICFCHTAPWH